jgi:hypothetical protein
MVSATACVQPGCRIGIRRHVLPQGGSSALHCRGYPRRGEQYEYSPGILGRRTRSRHFHLRACGTPAATARLAVLPAPPREEFWPRPSLIEVDPLDPTAPAPADLAAVTDQLAALDPSEFWRDLWLTAEEHRFDNLERVMARFAPQGVSGFYRRVFQSAPARQGMGLRQLGWLIPKHLLLIGPEEARTFSTRRDDQGSCHSHAAD